MHPPSIQRLFLVCGQSLFRECEFDVLHVADFGDERTSQFLPSTTISRQIIGMRKTMAETERTEAETGGTGKSDKRRDELDVLLKRIAAHISTVDEQHAPRSGQTDGSAGSTRATQTQPDGLDHEGPGPVEDSSVGARLEKDVLDAKSATKRFSGLLDDLEADLDGAPKPAATPSLRRPAAHSEEPPALRSAMPAAGAHGRATPAAEPVRVRTVLHGSSSLGSRNEVEPARHPAPSAAAEEPWDSAAAEALTRSWEHSVAEKSPAPSAAVARPGAVQAVAGLPDGGKAGEMLLAAARRVEEALDRLAPRDAIDALGLRLDGLETEVRSGTQRLSGLEAIEVELGELSRKLSDEHILTLFGGLVPTAEDLTQFAEDAAGRAADRALEAITRERLADTTAPASLMSAPSSMALESELRSTRDLIAAFMDDRRKSDAGTVEALETLQLAMQHLLDRVEQFEGAVAPVRDRPPVAHTQPRPAAYELDDDADFATEPVRTGAFAPQRAAPETALHRQLDDAIDRLPRETARNDYSEPMPRGPAASGTSGAIDYDELPAQRRGSPADMEIPAYTPPHQGIPGASPAATAYADTVHPGAGQPPLNDRQAFIAMARKAAEKAKADGEQKLAAGANAVRVKRASVLGAGAGGMASGVRPGVLVIAGLAAALLGGYWYVSGARLPFVGKSQPAAIHQAQPVATTGEPATAPTGRPDIEEASPESQGAPGGARRSSGTDDDVMPRALEQEASAPAEPFATGGPGIAVAQGGPMPNIHQVMRAREQAHIAQLSQRAAVTAARSHGAPAGTIDMTTASTGVEPASPSAPTQPEARQVPLPPAAIGPNSLRVAAAKGNASAQLEIATRFAEGRGVKQSFADAAVWYERAAAQGETVSQYRLATLYERGMGVKRDVEQAKVWYRRAAEQGNLKAMHNLAVMATSGAGTQPDYATAASLFAMAAQHGLADSQYNLGVLYESGLGVPKDHATAYMWYTLAAKGGDQDAAARRDQLIARLPAETVQAGDRKVAAFRPMTPREQANNARVAGGVWRQAASVSSN
jgi:localization factor PodJL